ncbi:FKBP-type peptidyl-prolyl cis-trans isomerase [Qaidamihabitans albus]|uniref:FKBP-type peptidyl-prolyl cis-trans isomerase n=1 Tax=Qaidamihabitans albus TaxID=2795733 RepID=UPI0018F22379|nr:FKBP-type peptidyl-prolyl cis-trans isomerase [Qaidamihabitans albus]
MRKAGKIMVVAAATFALVACSPPNEEPSDLPPGAEPTPTSQPTMSSTVPPSESAGHGEQSAECAAGDLTVTGELGQEPRVTIPEDCAPPKTLLREDLSEGLGPSADPGETVEVNYAVFTWSGELKDSTFGQERTVTLELGDEHEFRGWTEGLMDIQQNMRRLLVVPADLGYDPQSGHPLADETLVVVVDAVRITQSE